MSSRSAIAPATRHGRSRRSIRESLDRYPACFETPLLGLLSMRAFLRALEDLPHPEERVRAFSSGTRLEGRTLLGQRLALLFGLAVAGPVEAVQGLPGARLHRRPARRLDARHHADQLAGLLGVLLSRAPGDGALLVEQFLQR